MLNKSNPLSYITNVSKNSKTTFALWPCFNGAEDTAL